MENEASPSHKQTDPRYVLVEKQEDFWSFVTF